MTNKEIEELKLRSYGTMRGFQLALHALDNYPTLASARKRIERGIEMEKKFLSDPNKYLRELDLL